MSWSKSGGADTNGGVTTAQDECIIHYVRTAGTNVRTVAVDGSNNVWVGGLGNRVHELLDSDGNVVAGTQFNLGCGGYGGLVDANGILWSSSGNLLGHKAAAVRSAFLQGSAWTSGAMVTGWHRH